MSNGRVFWIIWCTLWALGWLLTGFVFFPLWLFVPLSLLAILIPIGRSSGPPVVIHQQFAGYGAPPPGWAPPGHQQWPGQHHDGQPYRGQPPGLTWQQPGTPPGGYAGPPSGYAALPPADPRGHDHQPDRFAPPETRPGPTPPAPGGSPERHTPW